MADLTVLKLQYMVVARERALALSQSETATLKLGMLQEQLRIASGASEQATFDSGPMTFTEPPGAAS